MSDAGSCDTLVIHIMFVLDKIRHTTDQDWLTELLYSIGSFFMDCNLV